jgi:hypothetical protein
VSPSSANIKAAVRAQKAEVASLFEQLRAGSLDPKGPGVTRDTYGPGEQFAYKVIGDRAPKRADMSDRAASTFEPATHCANLKVSSRRRSALSL